MSKIVYLTGGPGSGKTTALSNIYGGAQAEGRSPFLVYENYTPARISRLINECGIRTVCIEAKGSETLTKEAIEQLASEHPEVFFYVVI